MKVARFTVIGSIFLLSLMISNTSLAQCVQGSVICMNHATMAERHCTATVMCSGFATSTGFIMGTMSNNVASCSPASSIFNTPATFSVMAIANLPAPTTRSCGWSWYSASAATNGNFSITEADGLPVELMDYSVDQ